MPGMTEICVFLAWIAGGFVSGVSGIGGAMVAFPFLAMLLPVHEAIALTCIVNMVMDICLASLHFRFCRVSALWPMLLASVPESFAGLYILQICSGPVLQGAVGLLLLYYVYWQKTFRARGTIAHPRALGAVAGSRPLACAGFPAYLLEGHLVLVAYDAAMLETFSGGPDLEAAAARVKEATDAAARLEAVSVRQSAEAATAEGVQLRVDAAVDAALALPEVRQITVLAPVRPTRAPQDAGTGTPDAYWDLELPLLREDGSLPWQKLRNMERRALREVEVVREAWQPDHAALVQDFLRRKPFEPGTVHIFSHLESYVGSHPDVQLWAARHREDNSLQAFAVGDYASLTTAFYMFAFRRQGAVPGCADALLAGLVSEAEARGHMRFCLGLGIDPGIRFFKRKWHARPALLCLETGWSTRATTSGGGWFARLRRLLGGEEAA